MSNEIIVVGAARTAIGSFGGSLKDVPLVELATTAVRGALARSGLAAGQVGHTVMGNVIPTEPRDAYLSRYAAIEAGIPQQVPAMNVNRPCGSGLQAIISAAQSIALGDCDFAVAGGAEKTRLCLETFGLDAAVDYKAPDLAERLAAACAGGIDIHYDNTAGVISDQVHQHLNIGAGSSSAARPRSPVGIHHRPGRGWSGACWSSVPACRAS